MRFAVLQRVFRKEVLEPRVPRGSHRDIGRCDSCSLLICSDLDVRGREEAGERAGQADREGKLRGLQRVQPVMFDLIFQLKILSYYIIDRQS